MEINIPDCVGWHLDGVWWYPVSKDILRVNLDQNSMHWITLVSNNKVIHWERRDLPGCNEKESECQKWLKPIRIVLSCSCRVSTRTVTQVSGGQGSWWMKSIVTWWRCGFSTCTTFTHRRVKFWCWRASQIPHVCITLRKLKQQGTSGSKPNLLRPGCKTTYIKFPWAKVS